MMEEKITELLDLVCERIKLKKQELGDLINTIEDLTEEISELERLKDNLIF